MAIGLDFGTTNSSLALADSEGNVQLASFPSGGTFTQSFRSLLYLHRVRDKARTVIKSWSGPAGIAQYLEADEKGRLIQSL
ncbi:MAG: molecular chaperone, partial [Acidimicrobiales bacterium]|nr:molecular chaperone [Acidimicrobiales bacterium]